MMSQVQLHECMVVLVQNNVLITDGTIVKVLFCF